MDTEITTIIKARTKNQLLTITERPLIASGDANTVLVYFAFDPAWDAFTVKFACFHKANTPHIVYKMLISDDGYATVPHEVLDDAGDIFFGVKGYIPDHPEVIKTSLNVKYNIFGGATPSSSAPPTPDEFEQMMSEVGRISQEVKVYGENEAERSAAENTRKVNEDARKSAENERNSSEDDRKAAELTRVGDEDMRNSYEMARDMAEQQRAADEDIRKANEETRVSNETGREAAEAIRDGNEQTRVSNETGREAAEAIRDGNEQTRVANEAARVEAEAIRAAEFAQFEGRIDKNDKRITNLEQGLMADAFESDSSVAYAKTVPADALPFAEVQEVGGMSYAEGGEIKNAAVTAIESEGKNLAVSTESGNQTSYGITVTRFNGASHATLDGTGTFDHSMRLFGTFHLPAGTYTASVVGLNTSDRLYIGAGSAVLVNYVQTGVPKTFTVTEGADCFFQLVWAKGSKYTNTEIRAQVERGSTATTFAPYVKHTLPIPAEVQALDGWGLGVNETYHNRIDWEKKQYRQEVAKIRLPSNAGGYNSSNNWYYLGFADSLGVALDGKDVLCNMLPSVNIEGSTTVEGICINYSKTHVILRINGFEDQAAYRTWLSANEVYIIAELATPIVTDLPNLPDDNFIEVEGGGTITAVNEHGLAAPTEIVYQMKGVTA